MKVKNYKLQIRTLSPWSAAIGSIALLFFAACTDYVQNIEDQRDEWREATEQDKQQWGTVTWNSSSSSSTITKTSSSSDKISSSAKVSSSSESPESLSDENSSSSTIVSSSSSITVTHVSPCKTSSEDNCIYGTLKDSRDGKTYKTVTIGTQIWMAENLQYEVEDSWCMSSSNACLRYGRMYSWAAAMDSVGKFSNNSKGCGYPQTSKASCSATPPVRGVCPEGWHLPTREEFKILIKAVGGGESPRVLQSKGFSGWPQAVDSYGFAAQPIMGYTYARNMEIGVLAVFWGSSIDKTDGRSESLGINETGIFVYPDDSGPDHANAIRCLSDKAATVTTVSSSSVVASSSSERSSSSETIQSSSDVSSSSSEVATTSSSSIAETSSSGKESWAYLNPAISYGEMVDGRDGQVYKTVVIGEQTWMAENLNFDTTNSFCYNDSLNYCAKYGRLYAWTTAKKACPLGWHLPSKMEQESLIQIVGGQNSGGNVLKSKSDWNGDGNGIDVYGFTALPAGNRYANGSNYGKGGNANFWSSTEINSNEAYYMNLGFINDSVSLKNNYKERELSVRCIKDDPNNIITSSSSEDAESSSSKESWAYLNSAISYGEITDSRDGQIYKTVVIGKQTWMAENLNFETDSSFCYNNEESNCAKYGRLYRWAAAMDTLESECGYGSNTCSLSPGNVQGVCPSGWHLPSMAEWDTLIVAVGGQTAADKALKSSIGWSYGTDDFGFSAFPAGGRDYSGDYDYKGSDAHFWSSTEKSSTSAYYMLLKNGGGAGQSYSYKNYAYSIRCVKDE